EHFLVLAHLLQRLDARPVTVGKPQRHRFRPYGEPPGPVVARISESYLEPKGTRGSLCRLQLGAQSLRLSQNGLHGKRTWVGVDLAIRAPVRNHPSHDTRERERVAGTCARKEYIGDLAPPRR